MDYSAFGNTAVQAGQQGESALARIIAYMRLNVISFWSLYGLNENRQPINADIDCVLVGIDPQQQVHAWFVDAKNYKGGSDTKYVNLDPRNLVRMSISRRALVKGSDGTPVVKMSENMATQRDNWRPRSKPITWRPNGWSAWYRADITATRMSAKPSGRAMFVS